MAGATRILREALRPCFPCAWGPTVGRGEGTDKSAPVDGAPHDSEQSRGMGAARARSRRLLGDGSARWRCRLVGAGALRGRRPRDVTLLAARRLRMSVAQRADGRWTQARDGRGVLIAKWTSARNQWRGSNSQLNSSDKTCISDPGRTRTCNLWFRRPTPYPLGHRAS